MSWVTVVDVANADELRNVFPVIPDIPADTEIQIHIELAWWAPIGNLANIAGVEWWGQQLAGADVEVTDVSGDWYSVTIKGITRGSDPVTISAVILIALSLLGIITYYITRVYITANLVEQKKAEIAQDMINHGYTPEQISAVLNQIKSQTPSVPSAIKWSLVAAGIVIVAIIVIPKATPAVSYARERFGELKERGTRAVEAFRRT